MTIDNDDFFDESLTTESEIGTTKRMIELFNEWREKDSKRKLLEEELNILNGDLAKIKTEKVPEVLKEMGTVIWKDPDTGLTVELETAVNSKLPKDQKKRNEIYDALREIGIDEILAEEFNVTFAPNDRRAVLIREILGLKKDEDVIDDEDQSLRLTNAETDAIHTLREALQLGDLPAEEKLGAHPSRLKAWLKRKIDGGEGETIKAAGIWHGKHAVMTEPKGK